MDKNDETTAIENENPTPHTMRSVITVDVPDAGTQTTIALYSGVVVDDLSAGKTAMTPEGLSTGTMGMTLSVDKIALFTGYWFRGLIHERRARSWRLELARRCRQYQRRSRYGVSPYEIYARLYNRAHPERHISARRLNRLQRERAWKLFYHHQMPADYRRQR